jgi:hypothetical protein
MNNQKLKSLFPFLLCLVGGLLIGLGVAIFNPGRIPINGFLAGTILGSICLGALFLSWKLFIGTRLLAICMGIAFLLRLILGFGLTALLPIWGYPEESPQHGYLYLDAYQRDMDAWHLAQSHESLATAFGEEFSTDQYGGLLSLSAAIYRGLSPDAHRPVLILLLTSLFPALGIPFLWKAIRMRWNEKLATLSVWIFALYPESIILGSSQMREPFLIGLSAMACWGVVIWKQNRRTSISILVLSMAGMAFFSWLAAAAIFMVILIWFWFDNIHPYLKSSQQKIGWLMFTIIAVTAFAISLNWLINSARWDIYLMETSSGRIQFELDAIGNQWRVPFIVTYGLLQPVLPAAIAYPGIALMRVIACFRASGWYLLEPAIIFSFIAALKTRVSRDKRILLWFNAAFLLWVLISSIRAGGDQWDNVRYRAIFTTWMTVISAWGFIKAKEMLSPWLKRFFLVEGVFVLIFLEWYLSRYYTYLYFGRMRFWLMVLVIISASAAILIGGFLIDYLKTKKTAKLDHKEK